MPRDQFDDPETDGRYVQVNWRRAARPEDPDDPDADGGSPGHLQISTHDERADARVLELLREADQLVAVLTSAVLSGEQDSPQMAEARTAWRTKVDTFRAELTGTYVSLDRDTSAKVIKSLHRGRNLAWPPRIRVADALGGARIPRAGEIVVGTPELPLPGATGYPLGPELS